MARVLGPNNVPITPAIGGAPTRAGGESFGAQMANAQHDAGRALQSIGVAAGKLADQRQALEDADFETRAAVAFDDDFQAASLDEAGRLGSTERLRGTFKKRPDDVIQSLREQGYAPSKEAEQRAKLTGLTKASTYLRRNAAAEHNTRVMGILDNASQSVGMIGAQAAQSGDLAGGLEQTEAALSNFEKLLPPENMRKLRHEASERLLGAFADRPEQLDEWLDQLVNPHTSPARGSRAASETQGGRAATTLSPEGRAALKQSEGYAPVAKWDVRQHSGGYGTRARPGETFTPEKAEQRLTVETEKVSDWINSNVKVPLNQGAFDALVSFGFNLGTDDLEKLLPDINAGRLDRVAQRMPSFNKALNENTGRLEVNDGLTSRRRREAEMLLSGDQAIAEGMPDNFRGALARTLIANAPKIRAAAADRRRAAGLLSGEILADPGSKEDRDQIDNAMNSIQLGPRLRQADPSGAVDVTKVAVRAGFVPESALSPLRAMAANGNAVEKTFALQTAGNILRLKPGALASEGAKTLRDDAVLFAAMSEAGMPDQVALTRLREMRSPEFKKMSDAREKEVGKVLKDTSAADLTSAFDGWFSSAPGLGGSPREAGVIVDTYRDMVKYHYIRTGDADLAKGAAIQDLKGVMGVSEVAGKKRLMRYPPEQHLPRTESERPGYFAGAAGQRGDFKWFDQQLTESVEKMSGKRIPLTDIFLEAIPQTSADVRAGRDPTYGVIWFEEKDGFRVMQTAPGMVFRADRQAAETKQTEMRKAWLEEERQEEIDRREKQPGRVREALKTLIDPSRALIEKDGNFYLDPAPQINFGQDEATKTKRKAETDAVRGGIRRFLHPEDALTPMERPKRDLTVKPSY